MIVARITIYLSVKDRQQYSRLPFFHCQRGRQVAIGLDLLLQILHLLLGDGDRIGAGDEATRRLLLAGDRDQGARELGRVAGLLAVLGLVPLYPLRVMVGVVGDRRRRVARRRLRQEIGAEEPGVARVAIRLGVVFLCLRS
jgi:hypothetical protein